MSRIISIESNVPDRRTQLLKQLQEEYNYERDGNLFVYIGIHVLNLVLLTSIFGRTVAITPIITFYTAGCLSYYFYNIDHNNSRRPASIIFLDEPSYRDYVNENGENIKTLYHEHTHKYAFAFYISTLFERMAELEKAIKQHPNATIVMGGSIYTDFEIHIEALHEFGYINEIEYKIYKKFYECAISFYENNIYFIYIDCNGTEPPSGEFQKYCVEKYNELLHKISPIVEISCNVSRETSHEIFSKEILRNTIKAIRSGGLDTLAPKGREGISSPRPQDPLRRTT